MNQVIDTRVPMPNCLIDRPLAFGDREQILAIEKVSAMVAEVEKGKQQWRVCVTFEAEEVVTVWASSKKEAEELALEEVGDDYDLDISAYAREERGV